MEKINIEHLSFNDVIDMLARLDMSLHELHMLTSTKSPEDLVMKAQVLQYFNNIPYTNRKGVIQTAYERAQDINREITHNKYMSNKKKYEEQKKRNEEKGEKFKEEVQVGDIIKVAGTKDGKGFRLVLKKSDYDVECRKLYWDWKNKVYKPETYITTHYWDKVRKILHTRDKIVTLESGILTIK